MCKYMYKEVYVSMCMYKSIKFQHISNILQCIHKKYMKKGPPFDFWLLLFIFE